MMGSPFPAFQIIDSKHLLNNICHLELSDHEMLLTQALSSLSPSSGGGVSANNSYRSTVTAL